MTCASHFTFPGETYSRCLQCLFSSRLSSCHKVDRRHISILLVSTLTEIPLLLGKASIYLANSQLRHVLACALKLFPIRIINKTTLHLNSSTFTGLFEQSRRNPPLRVFFFLVLIRMWGIQFKRFLYIWYVRFINYMYRPAASFVLQGNLYNSVTQAYQPIRCIWKVFRPLDFFQILLRYSLFLKWIK